MTKRWAVLNLDEAALFKCHKLADIFLVWSAEGFDWTLCSLHYHTPFNAFSHHSVKVLSATILTVSNNLKREHFITDSSGHKKKILLSKKAQTAKPQHLLTVTSMGQ